MIAVVGTVVLFCCASCIGVCFVTSPVSVLLLDVFIAERFAQLASETNEFYKKMTSSGTSVDDTMMWITATQGQSGVSTTEERDVRTQRKARCLISLLVEKGCAACGKFISKLADRDHNLYRTLGLHLTSWNLYHIIPEFIKSDAALEGLLKDMQEMKLLRDGQVEEVKKQASTRDMTSELRSMVMRKGLAFRENFLSKLAERDPEFYNTYGPGLDPVDRLMRMQSQFVKRVSDAVIERLLKDMLEMKVLSDEDVEEVRDAPQNTGLGSWLLEQINSGRYPGLSWTNEALKQFRLPWKHDDRKDLTPEDTIIFKDWAVVTGRYREGIDQPDPADWRRHFQRTLDKDECLVLRADHSRDPVDPHKRYWSEDMLADKRMKVKLEKACCLISLLVEKGRAACGKFISKLAERDPKFDSTHEPGMDPVDRLRRVQSQFVKRVSDAVMEGLLKDMLEMKVLSDEDMEEVRDAPQNTGLGSWLLEQINIGRYPGLSWTNEALKQFRIPWKHDDRKDLTPEDTMIFKDWAVVTGRYREGIDQPDPAYGRRHFQRALDKDESLVLRADHSRDPVDPHKRYWSEDMLADKRTKVKLEKACCLISLLVEKRRAACGKFISKLAERDPNLYRTLELHRDSWSLVHMIPKFIKSDAVLEGLLKDMQEMKLLSDGEVEEVKKQASTRDRTSHLTSMVMRKGDAIRENFLSKLAERDPEFYSTRGPVDRLMQVQSQFVKRVSDAVMEGLLKDMLEMKVLSDEDVEEVRDAPQNTGLGSWLVEQINSGRYPGLSWTNEALKQFRIPWKHDDRKDLTSEDTMIFKDWAVVTGRYREGIDQPDPADWRRHFQRALDKDECLVLRADHSRDPVDPHKRYWSEDMLAGKRTKVKLEKACFLIILLVEKGHAACGKFISKLAERDPYLYRTLGLHRDSWNLFHKIPEFIKSDAVLEGLLKDMQEMKLLSDGEVEEVKKQASTQDRTSHLTSTVMRKGDAIRENFLSKLAERDPEFYSTRGPGLDPVDRLMQVQPQFVEGVSDAVMEGLLKDMLEMKVLSDEDVEEVRDAPQNTGLGSWLVEQNNSGRYPGLSWTNEALKQFRIPWKHDDRKDLTPEDTMIFKDWAVVTGRYREGIDQPDPADWRRHFQRALDKDECLVLRADHSRDPVDPHKIYWSEDTLADKRTKVKLEKACCLIILLVEKGCAACGKFISKLAERDTYLYRTLGLHRDSWNLFHMILEFIKSAAALEGLLKDMQEMKLLSDGEVEEVKKQASTRDRTSHLTSMVMRKGDAIRENFLSKLAERDPEFCNTHGLDLDPVDRLMQVQSQFVKRVSDAVMEGLLKDMLEMKVLSDEDVKEVRDAPQYTGLGSWLLKQINSGRYPGLTWTNEALKQFRIPWKHDDRKDLTPEDTMIFKDWAVVTGRYREGIDQPDPAAWRRHFQRALDKDESLVLRADHSRDPVDPHKRYWSEDMLADKRTKVKLEKACCLISLLVEKRRAACGKFISKLTERDPNLYRTLELHRDISGWNLFHMILEFIKSDAALEGLLKDMQMKLLSDGEVEEVKKQASTRDRTSHLTSMVMRKGDAIRENFLSKLAERDPEFCNTHGLDLDPVDRLMQVQSQFVKRVSDAVIERLLKDMLEMKVLSDEDVDEVRDAPQNTGLGSWLLEQINSGRYPGLSWTNEALKQFRLPWKHDDRKDLTPEDTIIFKDWAVVTGRYREGIDQPDPADWRRHFQRALDKDECLVLRADHSRDPVDPHKIYWSEDMLADKRMKVKLEKACCLISLLVEKGRAACGKFISKLAERDPKFDSTHEPGMDPVDRLMQVQSQFVERVSDAVIERLLKDMLEMKVLSDEDVEEVRDAPQNTGLGSWLLEQINSGRYPGLSWTNEALKQFRIPWKHDDRKDLTPEDTMIFKDWAVVTGRYREGIDQPDPADWRRHFQRALDKDECLVLRADHSRDPVDPHKIYWSEDMLADKRMKVKLEKACCLISLLVEKGRAACGKFISKLAERDPKFDNTRGPGLDPVDRLMQVQSQFVKRVSDVVIERLLKDMLEMKVLSDEDVEEVRDAPQNTGLGSWLLEQINSGRYPGLSWTNEALKQFRIPWKHDDRKDLTSEDTMIFKDWAVVTGCYREGIDQPDPTYWRRHFQRALNKDESLVLRADHSRDPVDPHKIYWSEDMLADKRTKVKLEKACCLISLLVEKRRAACGKFISKLAGRDPNLYRTLGLNYTSWNLFPRIPEFIKSDAVLEGLLKDMQEMKLLSDGEVEEVKKQASTQDRTSHLTSTVMRKGDAIRENFLSKLAERDPEFYNTRGLGMDPVDRLMQVQSQFVKRVSDAVMEGLLKDMLEMKVLSDEDVEEVRDAPQYTGLGSWLLEQINSGWYPGLSWTNEALKQFRIPWKHDDRKDLTPEDTMIFKDWAVVTGRYREGIDQPDPAYWRRHFQRTLDKDKSLVLRADHSRDPVDPHKIYWISSSNSSGHRLKEKMLALRRLYSLEHRTRRLSIKGQAKASQRRRKVRQSKRRSYSQEMSPECKKKKGNCDPVSEKSQGDHSMCEAAENEVSELRTFRPTVHHEGRHKYYRFSFEKGGEYQCEITALIFDMAAPAEVVYGTEQWEKCPLDQSSLLPAGPLYDINSPSGALEHLSFPHSECSPEVQNHLMVAHYKNGNVELIKPTEVTETHVKIKVNETSPFGLVRRLLKNWLDYKSKAQVLLFLRQLSEKKKLNIFLLSSNVVLDEVQEKQKGCTFIETSSHCDLWENEPYSVSCDLENAHVQPDTYDFVRDYGPNFPPTFEIFLNNDVKELTVKVINSTRRDALVWSRRVLLDGAHSPVGPPRPAPPEIENNTLVNECGWKQALFDIIEELTGREYKKMKMLLNKEIPLGKLEETDRESMAHLIISQCGLQKSIQVTQELMRQIPRNDERIQSLLQPFLEQTG
ncbi:uncharacterized protein LOC117969753 isoform X3 [Acipenser ruthenus]|uniref:uncharacterized protein LOC117969753 isoform X3 n=1 Tax=Acipenser ruthenus TaxID=7906 RepID=UPI002740A419|nr:uncharacterized protein LOC117969753 isoform X3 [Acipenser ruthenus]